MNLPDTRGWIALGLFALTTYVFTILALNISQSDLRQLFVVLATALVSGGLMGVVGFYFGSSKESSSKDAVISAQAGVDLKETP